MNRVVCGKGGNLHHSLPEGTMTAVCGYKPSGHSYHMKDRSGWWTNPNWRRVTCEKCRVKLGFELKVRSMPIKHATVNPQPHTDFRRALGRDLSKWANAQVAGGRVASTVHQDLEQIFNYIKERFFDKHNIPGVTYYFHDPSDSYFILGPHDHLSDAQAQECDELTREEYLERTAL